MATKKSSILRLAEINHLLSQLSERAKPLTLKKFNETILKQKNFCLLRAYLEDSSETGQLVGMGSIYFEHTLSGFKGYIDDVVVDKMYRGLSIGEQITRGLIRVAKKRGAEWIDLTSNPKRKAAIALYKKLGFRKRDSKPYRLVLKKK
ncbi:MAG: hypothetical protein A3I24_02410 [Candidatus Harrisonbacteria bacterium RIFCSPLOWO2_02_FULL_41_13b]|uniref:N-acetyltransferase domain-containing protein n=1 Tax=Candidatus Harrisonbacteria bacterium RIFCSPLOWO2_02_FULL_41_13b TaxID=1798409 RepID=A0A1G1ZU75_9BACT|nr:MAG: hypothetical protein A3J53_02535 [Candidatus Harrisonbacteria bacterium RIFCSPHIGHO2_02_FULL_40_20]OGY68104.1 MAG: hypothetical protein A3I24_02410 [Candidatus Harrisonbacteria bacterium RIFCSPLOWO2_02_FULL_41_13b]